MTRSCANFLFSSAVSVLMAKSATLNFPISMPLSRSDRHSAVQGAAKALTNQASTTACLLR
jgi:hypothetical protein